ncbi:MAG: RusA family crossover junction endodeoxyribonuclease [Deltaproteobacteria bacterium]
MITEPNTITLLIPGQPISKNRPRFTRVGKGVRTYSDQSDEEWLWVMVVRQQLKELAVRHFSGAVAMKIVFWMKRPAGHFGSGKNAGVLKASAPASPVTKPDIDNLLKFLADCLNHCSIWVDDSYIADIDMKKRYAEPGTEPRTELVLREVNDV